MMVDLNIQNNAFKIILLPGCSATEAEVSSAVTVGVVNKTANTVYSQLIYIISFGLEITNYNVDFTTDVGILPQTQQLQYPYRLLELVTTPARITFQNVALPVPDPLEIEQFIDYINNANPNDINLIILQLRASHLYDLQPPDDPMPVDPTATDSGAPSPTNNSSGSTIPVIEPSTLGLIPPPQFPAPAPNAIRANPINPKYAPPIKGLPVVNTNT